MGIYVVRFICVNVGSPSNEKCLMNNNSDFFCITNPPVGAKNMNLMSHKHLLNVILLFFFFISNHY